MQLFADHVNTEMGGVNVGGKKLAIRFVWVDDKSSKTQVMNATAVALRHAGGADFAWAGYSSGLTIYTTKQTSAEGLLMMSGGAASSSAFNQNNLSFGLFPPAASYTLASLQGIAAAADKIDAGRSTRRGHTHTHTHARTHEQRGHGQLQGEHQGRLLPGERGLHALAV